MIMPTPHLIVTEARSWIGTPYRHQASLKSVGCDCLGLLRGVWRGVMGAEPELPPPYSPDWAEAGADTLVAAARKHLVEIDCAQVQAGDVLLFRWRDALPAKHCAIAGATSLAGATLTLSVENPSGPLPVVIGSKAATIPAGPGRQSASVTLDGQETGNITLRLQPEAACSFKHVKLELGAQATPWSAPPLDIEDYRCRRHFQRLSTTGGAPGMLGYVGQRIGMNIIDAVCTLPVPMRADPTLLTSGFTWINASPAGNQVAFFSNSSAVWAAMTGSLTVTTATPTSTSCVVLRFRAGTSFSAAAGGVGNVHLGTDAFIALEAEL